MDGRSSERTAERGVMRAAGEETGEGDTAALVTVIARRSEAGGMDTVDEGGTTAAVVTASLAKIVATADISDAEPARTRSERSKTGRCIHTAARWRRSGTDAEARGGIIGEKSTAGTTDAHITVDHGRRLICGRHHHHLLPAVTTSALALHCRHQQLRLNTSH